jgi:hypothetical protein
MPAAPQSDLQANVLKALAGSVAPLAPSAIAKALPVGGRPQANVLKGLLAQMAGAGLLVRIPGKTEKYVAAPIEDWARAALLALLAAGPQTEAKLKQTLTKGYEHLLGDLTASLLVGGKVFRHPPVTAGGKPKFALHPADPVAYLAKDLDKLLLTVAKKGFAPEAVRDAALRHLGATAGAVDAKLGETQGPTLAGEEILQAMRRLEPRVDTGAAVSISRLRRALEARCDKNTFDAAVVSLAQRGVLELQSHAWPTRLSNEERDALIANGRGGWFDSVARRRGPAS